MSLASVKVVFLLLLILTEVAALMTFPLSTWALEQASDELGRVGFGSPV